MYRGSFTYLSMGVRCNGYLAYDDTIGAKRAALLVAPTAMGNNQTIRDKADAIAALGYVAIAADLYGEGRTATTQEGAAQLMLPLFVDRKLLRQRIGAAFSAAQKLPQVTSGQIGAIGFCFGGLAVIELLRSGEALRGVVSVHGLIGNRFANTVARTERNADTLHGAFLGLHGDADPFVQPEEITALQKELTGGSVDWQWHTYGQTAHAFTNPHAEMPQRGLLYSPKAERRAWQSMVNFFREVL